MKNTKITLRKKRHVRIKAKMSGTAARPRLVVFRSLNATYCQLVDDANGKTLLAGSDIKMKKGAKTERAKKVGADLAEKAAAAGIKSCVFDRNGYKYHGRIKALAEGAREGGLKF
ncbi:50S ribosomal protein L18 [Candidatus Peregrinibacteria bacterium]|nr:50S ribosomal protein L18 [Candidatus Peregrinibacteria bacterium]